MIETNAVSGRPELLVVDRRRTRVITPRFSSRFTRWCTAEVDRPVALPRSVKDIRPSAASSRRIMRSVSSTRDDPSVRGRSGHAQAGCARGEREAADAPGLRVDVLPGLLRRPRGHRRRRHAGQRRARVPGLHQPARRRVPARPTWSAAGTTTGGPQWRVDLLPSYKAHRVVAAVPGPRPDIEEVPGPARGPDPDHPRGARRRRALRGRRRRLRGGRRHRDARDRRVHAGRRRHRRPRPLPARRRRHRRADPLHRPRRRQARAGDRRAVVREKYGVRPPVRRLRDPAR